MTEQSLMHLSDTQSTDESSIRRSISDKLDILINPPTSSSIDDVLAQLAVVSFDISSKDTDMCASLYDTDTDSFDDENDPMADSYYSPLPSTSSNYTLKSCPICLTSSMLQSALCCEFRCCNICWRAHISSTINDGRIKIACASSECDKFLSRETITNLIRSDSILHERYLKLYANINLNPRAKTCPRCSHLYSLDTQPVNSKKSSKKLPKQVQCSECALVWCFRCSAPWHENFTCKQFLKGDKLLLKWINQKNEEQWNARKCPKCSLVIQRNGGCPHMTCSSCSCEFCYLCGRRYMKIPVIGQHHSKFSVLGCPYNLHPEKPWLRRTIRGAIATGVIVASPLIVVGAATAAVTVLPTVGIYKLIKRARNRRYTRTAVHEVLAEQQTTIDLDEGGLDVDVDFNIPVEIREALRRLRQIAAANVTPATTTTEDDSLLSIFADMDVEHLFVEDEKLAPAIPVIEEHVWMTSPCD